MFFAANNGCEGLEALKKVAPDLILTDVVMPRLSGPMMVREMQLRGVDVPVIFLSGYTDDCLAIQEISAGLLLTDQKAILRRQIVKPSRPSPGIKIMQLPSSEQIGWLLRNRLSGGHAQHRLSHFLETDYSSLANIYLPTFRLHSLQINHDAAKTLVQKAKRIGLNF